MTTLTTTMHAVFNPRRELLLLASAVFEMCWAFCFFAILLAASGNTQRGVSVFTLMALAIAAIYSSRIAFNLPISLPRRQVLTVGLALLTMLVMMRVTIFSNFALFDLTWLGRLPGAIGNLFIVFSLESLLLVMSVFAWWRGLTLSQAALDFESVGFRFRLGVLMLALATLINTFVGRADLNGLLLAFFFFALLAVALARQEDAGRSESSISLPLKGPWLGILGGSVAAVLGLGLLLSLALTPQGVRAFFDLFKPLAPLASLILYAFIIIIAFFVEIVYNIFAYVLHAFGTAGGNTPLLQLPPRPVLPDASDATDLSAIIALWDPVRIMCAVALFIGVLLMLGFSLNQMQKRQRALGNETRESVPIGLDLNPFKRLRQWLRRSNGDEWDENVASIRRIYANLIKLAARRGFPRREAQTPYEFMQELRAAFPGVELEERAVTEAYVQVHYGEYNPSAAEVARIKAAWEKIRNMKAVT